MVSELGKAFLEALATSDAPLNYNDVLRIAREQQPGIHFYYSFPTYVKRYLVDKGLIDSPCLVI